jgi:hypothetical protein
MLASNLPDAFAMATSMIDGAPVFNWSPMMLSSGAFFQELAATIAGGLWYNLFATEDILGMTHRHLPIDNTGAV